jgi:hypothetical protein
LPIKNLQAIFGWSWREIRTYERLLFPRDSREIQAGGQPINPNTDQEAGFRGLWQRDHIPLYPPPRPALRIATKWPRKTRRDIHIRLEQQNNHGDPVFCTGDPVFCPGMSCIPKEDASEPVALPPAFVVVVEAAGRVVLAVPAEQVDRLGGVRVEPDRLAERLVVIGVEDRQGRRHAGPAAAVTVS